MARYIKANPKVAQYLNLENDRNTVADGNYLLWQADMLEFGPLTELNQTLAIIGGIALMPHEAREEQDGTVTRPLPEPTDERFRYQPVAPVEEPGEEPESETEALENQETGEAANEEAPVEEAEQQEAQEENQGETETPAESQEPESEVSADQPEEENGESQEIKPGDVGSVEDLVDFAPEEETE